MRSNMKNRLMSIAEKYIFLITAINIIFYDLGNFKFSVPAGRLSQPLNDETFFNSVKIDETGGITWSNGFDFALFF